ncbi:MAG: hypothetical protein ACR2G6_07220 [Gemmatimonadaceae bacterium]
MWSLIKALLAKWTLFRILLKGLGSLGILLPLALLLKAIGWPVFLVLAVLAIPVFSMFLLFGLPVFLVLLFGGGLLVIVFSVLALGLAVLKLVFPVLLIVMLVWCGVWILRWLFGGNGGSEGTSPA